MSHNSLKSLLMLLPILAGALIAMISNHYLGPDNPVEEEMETVVEEAIEEDLGLGHVLDGKIDFSPATRER